MKAEPQALKGHLDTLLPGAVTRMGGGGELADLSHGEGPPFG
jgi:hypothetical protein